MKSKSEETLLLTRREALKLSAAAGVASALSRQAHASDSIKTGVHQQEPPFCSTPRTAIANTQYGKVRGFVSGDVFTFKGVPYGATTAGENRWLPAKPPAPWNDEYPALVYGANCPQNLRGKRLFYDSREFPMQLIQRALGHLGEADEFGVRHILG